MVAYWFNLRRLAAVFVQRQYAAIFVQRRLAAVGISVLASSFCASQSFALGGSATSDAPRELKSHIVMVLGSRGSVCSGTVVARRVVLTAAHCVIGSKQIAIGYHDENKKPVLLAGETVAIHPGYSKKAKVSIDMALVRVPEGLPSRFEPVRLDRMEEADLSSEQTIAGFGVNADEDPDSAGTLRSASVDIIQTYPRFLRVSKGESLRKFAICKGDSGGPILANRGGPLLIAVVYAAEKTPKAIICGATAQAVRIGPQRNWIDGIMGRWEKHGSLRLR